jgi:hypothetical protein
VAKRKPALAPSECWIVADAIVDFCVVGKRKALVSSERTEPQRVECG